MRQTEHRPAGPSCWAWDERGPLPEATELPPDSGWHEFMACHAAWHVQLRQGRRDAQAAVRGIEEVMRVAQARERICPMPGAWKRLHALLVSAQLSGAESPPLPVSTEDWRRTTDMQKATRLRELVLWAHRQGALRPVHRFLAALPEREWHHLVVPDWPDLRRI